MPRTRKGAPYVEPNRAMLGDAHLSPEEAVCREREDLLKKASRSRIHGQAELEDPNRAAGPRLHYSEIIRRLRTINPSLKFLDGTPGNVAVYAPKRRNEYDSEERDISKPEFFWHHRYVGGFPLEWLPEYAHVTLDTSGLPVREVRGWRSVLLSLIKAKAISVTTADEFFGDPGHDRRAGRWREQIFEYQHKERMNV